MSYILEKVQEYIPNEYPSLKQSLLYLTVPTLSLVLYRILKRKSKPTEKFQKETPYDVIVVGAGVTGASLAYALGKQGKRVLVIERDLSEPDRIVGEMMQPAGILRLEKLGLADCVEGIDSPKIQGYGIIIQGDRIKIQYPKTNGKQNYGRSFHHGKFVMQLRKRAQSLNNVTFIQAGVSKLIEENGKIVGVEYEGRNGSPAREFAPLTCVCSGANTALRKQLNNANTETMSHFVGIIIKESPNLPFPNYGHVIFAKKGHQCLCYPISSSESRILIDFPANVPLPSISNGDMKKYILENIVPFLPKELQKPLADALNNGGRIRSMPNRDLVFKEMKKQGAILLGDALNCRHPLTGGGMSVALSDVCELVAELEKLKDLRDYSQVDTAINNFYHNRRNLAATINILANALYGIFASQETDTDMENMKNSVMHYFRLGGICVEGPIGFLSGLDPSPHYLLFHFFMVAFVGCFKMLFPIPYPQKIKESYSLVKSATLLVRTLIYNNRMFRWAPNWGVKPSALKE